MQEHDLTLEQMLADPIVRQLMARDGVAEADLRGLVACVRPRRRSDHMRIEPEPRSFGAALQAD